ncbi:ABC transporter permease [Fundicoccus culcitae]|uniref:ABC transporter permease subunit n=1 Tax=Fundicoccus culcitae TaxID=2969821 RepID=A0ABY5P3S6_9LACT|nr:ABC transporter permease subunit [Fundicoccus culcitae]UUX33382.1 ABC transporter permease subunit [Fundicoccus culcitae]
MKNNVINMKNKWLLFLFIPILYLFVAFLVIPSITTFVESFTTNEGEFTFRWLELMFTNDKYGEYILNTLGLGFATVIVCGIVGFSLAFAFNFYDFNGKFIGKIIALLPICLPGTLFVYACVNIFGPTGVLGNILTAITGSEEQLYSFTGFWPILLIHALSQYINFYVIISYGLTKIDKSQMESSIILGASKFKVFKDSFFIPLLPSIASAAGLTLIGGMGSYAAPSMIGGSFITLTVGINTARQSGNLHISSMLSIISSLLVIISLILIEYFSRKRTTTLSVKYTPFTTYRFKSKVAHNLFTLYIWLLIIVLMLPIIFVVLFSFFPPKSSGTFTLDNFTLSGFSNIWNYGDIVDSLKYTFEQSFIVAIITVIIALVLALISLRTNWKFKSLANGMAHFPTFISDVGYAIAVIVTFNVPQWFVGNQALYGDYSLLIIILALLSVTLAYKNFYSAIQRISTDLDEASSMLGASEFYTMRKVIFPIITPIFISTFIITMIYKLQEYTINAFIGPIGNSNIAMLIRSLGSQENDKSNMTWVLGTIVLVIVIFLLVIYNKFSNTNDSQQVQE